MFHSNEKYLLIDAVFVNNGGGKIILNYLIQELEKQNILILYLLDHRAKKSHYKINGKNKVVYIDDSLISRHLFYLKHQEDFAKVLCFGNVPPTVKLSCKVYTYFHNLLHLQNFKNDNQYNMIIRFLKLKVIYFFKKNTNVWLVQGENMKSNLMKKLEIEENSILCLPFFNIYKDKKETIIKRVPNSFVYVSFYRDYKNHEILVDGFVKAYSRLKKGELHLTLEDMSVNLKKKLNQCKRDGIPIINHGKIDNRSIPKLYMKSEYLIFPSLFESFGLPLAEGIKYGCKVLAADRIYTDDVCIPSAKFNPLDENSISLCIENAMNTELKESKLKIKNKIEDLLSILNY